MSVLGNIGSAIYDILTSDAEVLSIYGYNVGPSNNLYDTTDYPRIVYTITDVNPSNTKGINGASKLDEVRVEIALFNLQYFNLVTGQEYVRVALDYIGEGTYPNSGSNQINLQSCSLIGMSQDFIEDFGENGIYVGYLEFQFRQKL